MEDNLIELLESFNFPVIRQGSLSPDEQYPPTFFTFWNNDEEGQSYYDNNVILVTYDYDVNVYSNNPQITYDLLKQARNLLKQNDWIIADRGYDVPSDEITHTGRGMRVIYLNKEVN